MSDPLANGIRLGSPANPLVVTLTVYEGHRLLDIRKYFVEKSTKLLKPTRKGVSLNARLAREVLETVNTNAEEIFSWLEGGDDSTLAKVADAMVTRSAAVESEAVKAREIDLEAVSWKGPTFFSVAAQGNVDQLQVNLGQPICDDNRLSDPTLAGPNSPLALILAAYHRAKLRFAGDIDADSEQFFRMFEHEWGVILRNYCAVSGA